MITKHILKGSSKVPSSSAHPGCASSSVVQKIAPSRRILQLNLAHLLCRPRQRLELCTGSEIAFYIPYTLAKHFFKAPHLYPFHSFIEMLHLKLGLLFLQLLPVFCDAHDKSFRRKPLKFLRPLY